MTGFVSTLLLIQGALMVFGFQVKRVDFDWSARTNTIMPKVAKWSITLSLVFLPTIIIVFTLCGAFAFHTSVPFLALNLCC